METPTGAVRRLSCDNGQTRRSYTAVRHGTAFKARLSEGREEEETAVLHRTTVLWTYPCHLLFPVNVGLFTIIHNFFAFVKGFLQENWREIGNSAGQ